MTERALPPHRIIRRLTGCPTCSAGRASRSTHGTKRPQRFSGAWGASLSRTGCAGRAVFFGSADVRAAGHQEEGNVRTWVDGFGATRVDAIDQPTVARHPPLPALCGAEPDDWARVKERSTRTPPSAQRSLRTIRCCARHLHRCMARAARTGATTSRPATAPISRAAHDHRTLLGHRLRRDAERPMMFYDQPALVHDVRAGPGS